MDAVMLGAIGIGLVAGVGFHSFPAGVAVFLWTLILVALVEEI